MKRLVGFVAILAIVVLLAGVPSVLMWVSEAYLPTQLPTLDQIWLALSRPDDGSIVAMMLVAVAWLAWLYISVALLTEIWAALRRIKTPQLPGFSFPQGIAKRLVGAAMLAVVAMPALAGASHAAPPEPTSSASATPSVPQQAAPNEATAPAQSTRYVVQPGDTLFKLSEKYWGNGWLYPSLFEANRGTIQANGTPLVEQDLIIVGTELVIPVTPPAGPNTINHTVTSSDTIESIARKVLGSSDRAPEVLATNPQAADLKEGQVLIIPVYAPGAGPVVNPSTAGPVPPVTPTTPAPSVAPTTPVPSVAPATPAPTADPSSVPDQIRDAGAKESEYGFPTMTTFGVGAILAGGIVSLIAARRIVQRRKRARGVPLAMPEGAAARVEHELRTVGDQLAIAEVDRALRGIAAHCTSVGIKPPEIRMARLIEDTFEIYLAEPVKLPAPWVGTSDEMMWTYQGDRSVEQKKLEDVPAPYPALVSLGRDQQGATVLVDLETIGELSVTGPEKIVKEALAAIAVELATSEWADDLTVTVVGGFATMEDTLRTGRINYLPTVGRLIDELAHRAESDRLALELEKVSDIHHARVLHKAPSTWYPEIVLLTNPLPASQKEQLDKILAALPRVAIAAVQVTDQDSEWTLGITGAENATLQPPNLQITPQRIDTDAYDKVLEIIDITQSQQQQNTMAPAAVADLLAEAESLISHGSRLGSNCPPSEVNMDPSSDDSAVPVVGPREGQPYLKLLGPVQLINAPGPVEPSRQARLTEYVAYLLLTPVVTPEGIDEAIWPNRTKQNNSTVRDPATSRARKWLGNTADATPRLEARTYKLMDVGSDWNDFQMLTSGSLADVPTPRLRAAMNLVAGAPFNRIIGRNWAWAEPHQQRMITLVLDTCYELASRQLRAEQYRECEGTLVIGLDIEPGDESLWRMRILTAHARHNPAAVDEAINRLYGQLGSLDSLEPRTEEFLHALKNGASLSELVELLQA